jgi:hypothetical protein
MALSETLPKTSWGDVHVYLGVMGDNEALSTAFEDLGAVDPDNFSIQTEEGTVYSLKDINGKLLDELRQEPSLKIGFGLLKPTEKTRGKFWTVVEEGEGDARKLKVTSLVNNTPMSFKLANPKAVGSETLEVAKAKVYMALDYAPNKGYSGKCEIGLLWPDRTNGELFQFGVVPAATGA